MADDGSARLERARRAAPPGPAVAADRRRFWRRVLIVAVGIYLALTAAFFATAPRAHLTEHTRYNHYALLAEGWLEGRLDLGAPPPRYTGNNDFARYQGRYYVSFPPFPAVLLLPAVALAGSAAEVADGAFFVALGGVGPAVLFFLLEQLRRQRRSPRSERDNAALALLFGLGTVYWFSAVQGTVWFAAHVVGVALLCLHLLFSLRAAHPLLAGLTLGLAVATRPTLAFAAPVFLYEAYRAARLDRRAVRGGRLGTVAGADVEHLLGRVAAFAAPLLVVALLLAWHNHLRFDDAFEFGHRHLQVRWRHRIDRWGLFSYHYLGRNLAVVLAGLPFWSADRGLQVSGHGLALWLTTPLYAFALWPRRPRRLYFAFAAAAAAVALPNLLYQNTGWIQFGYRFSNDFAPLLFVMIALGRRRFGRAFWGLAALAVLVNAVGAVTFGKAAYRDRYVIEPTQQVLFQPD